MRRATLLGTSVVAVCALFAACFPDYQIAPGAGGGPNGGDGAPGADGTANGGDGDIAGDGATGGDGGIGQDGSSGQDGASGFDAAGAPLIPGTGVGGFAYQSPSGSVSSKVLITHDFYLDGKEST